MPNSLEFLENRGYHIKDQSTPWRHMVGTLEKNGQLSYFKMAGTEEISPKTEKETLWNDYVNSLPKGKLPFLVPRIYETGKTNNLFWFICEYIDGTPITDDYVNHIDFIVDSAVSVLHLPSTPLSKEDKEKTQQKVTEKVRDWRTKTSTDTTDLHSFFLDRLEFIERSVSHGDFVPEHFLKSEKGIYLIDGEHVNFSGVKFYDIAYFYHRVYTKLKRPDIARTFLAKFRGEYHVTEKDEKCFELILAQRLIGGYMDAESDNLTSKELSKQLEKELLKS